jgi:hypothetical protein
MQREDHQPPAAPEYPAELPNRAGRVMQVAEQVIADHQVEGGVLERQCVNARLSERDGAGPLGTHTFGGVDQALADVHADDVGTEGREAAGEVPFAAAGVQDPPARARADRVEDGPVGELGPVPVMALSDDLDPVVGVRLPPLAGEVGDVPIRPAHSDSSSPAWLRPRP